MQRRAIYRSLSRRSLPLLVAVLHYLPVQSWSQADPPQTGAVEPAEYPVEAASADEIMDAQNSIDDASSNLGWVARGDLRSLYFYNDEESRQGETFDDDSLIGRVRAGVDWTVLPTVRISAQLAGSCSDEDCDISFTMDNELDGGSLERGLFTFDELYIHVFKTDDFDLALGRMQTRLPTRAGLFNKSLDRADSNNANITWTDGFHGTMRHANGWESNGFLQYNPSDGATNRRWAPLDFSADNSRVTAVFAFNNLQPWGPIVQRGFDINYLPSSLLKDGVSTGRREDYWGFVGRGVAEWPLGAGARRFRFAAEVGYAPETQTEDGAGIGGGSDVSGLAWNVACSVMDFMPGHDIGVNYGQVEAGWLLSSNFANNEELIEIRYRRKISRDLSLEFRMRRREELDRLENASQKRDRFDAWLRISWRFPLREL